LFVVPVIFTITDDLQQWMRRLFAKWKKQESALVVSPLTVTESNVAREPQKVTID
jgi:hypothetical protein